MKRRAGKALCWLLGIMLLFTVISRVTASVTVPQVETETPAAHVIRHTVVLQGRVESAWDSAVWTEPGLLVEHVYVEPGQQVETGDVLAVLNEEQLAEQVLACQEELRILELTNEAAVREDVLAAQERERARERAAWDYDAAVRSAQAQVDRAAQELGNAKAAYERAQVDGVPHSVEEQAALLAAAQAAAAAYENALLQQEQSVRAASRAVEDAASDTASGNQEQINEIRIGQLERELEPLLALQEAGGKIVAPCSGVIKEISLVTGQRTSDTAAVTMAEEAAGLCVVAESTDAGDVTANDAVTVTDGRSRQTESVLAGVERRMDGGIRITVPLADADFSLGETVSLQIDQASTDSRLSVPATALHEQNGSYYVLVIGETESVLGTEYQAVRLDVTVQDRNELYAALEEGVISEATQIIVDSDRYVEAGDRVRLWEE